MSAKVIALQNQKGGVGKTTLATALAASFAEAGHKVLLVDADTQGSSLLWQANRSLDPLFSVVGIAHGKMHLEIARMKDSYDYIVIDGPPRVTEIAKSILVASDITIIPVQPSPYDIWASSEIVDLCREMQIYRPDFKAAFLINLMIPNTLIGRSVDDALAGYGFPRLRTTINRKVIYAEAVASGMTLREAEGRRGESAALIDQVSRETLEMLEA